MTLRETDHQSAGQSPVDDHYRSAGDGTAQSTTVSQPAYGGPEPIEPAKHVSVTKLPVQAHDGGQSISGTRSTSAAVPLSDPATAAMQTEVLPPDRGAARTPPAKARSTRGGSKLSEPANLHMQSVPDMQARGAAPSTADTLMMSGGANSSHPANQATPTRAALPDGGGGQGSSDAQSDSAPAKKTRKPKDRVRSNEPMASEGDGHSVPESLTGNAVATIVDLWRQRVDLKRAAQRLNLQALAVCRRASDGDKEAAQKVWALIQKGQGDENLAVVIEPYRIAMAGLDASAHALEKQLAKLIRKEPIWAWAVDVRGLGELSVAGIIGEASGNPGDYRSVSALWKRFGLAVIEGERQRRVAGAEAALLHGYAPQRRAFAYVISCNLMKSQKAEDPYRQLYDRRKAYELEREIPNKDGEFQPVTKAHAHNRALRCMVKELLKHAWAADRRLRA